MSFNRFSPNIYIYTLLPAKSFNFLSVFLRETGKPSATSGEAGVFGLNQHGHPECQCAPDDVPFCRHPLSVGLTAVVALQHRALIREFADHEAPRQLTSTQYPHLRQASSTETINVPAPSPSPSCSQFHNKTPTAPATTPAASPSTEPPPSSPRQDHVHDTCTPPQSPAAHAS